MKSLKMEKLKGYLSQVVDFYKLVGHLDKTTVYVVIENACVQVGRDKFSIYEDKENGLETKTS